MTSCEIHEGLLWFDPADGIYPFHFPERPVVPGCLIVQAFVEVTKKIWTRSATMIEAFAFRAFVVPGEYRYRVEYLSGRVKCRLYRGEEVVVSGVLCL